MEIEIYIGKVGSGKTMSAVDAIARAMSRGQVVSTNIVLICYGFVNYCMKEYGFIPKLAEQYLFFSMQELIDNNKDVVDVLVSGTPDCHSMLVLDEANKFFGNRDWSDTRKRHKRFLDFLVECRHHYVDIIFLIQAVENLDKAVFRQAQIEWWFYDGRYWGPVRVAPPGIHVIHQVARYPNQPEVVYRRRWFVGRLCYGTYVTDQKFEGGALLAPANKVKVKLCPGAAVKRRVWKYSCVGAVASIPFLIFGCARREKLEYQKLNAEMRKAKDEQVELVREAKAVLQVARNSTSNVARASGVSGASTAPGPAVATGGVVRAKGPLFVVCSGIAVDSKAATYTMSDGRMLTDGDWLDDSTRIMKAGERVAMCMTADGLQPYFVRVVKVAVAPRGNLPLDFARGETFERSLRHADESGSR